MRYTKEVNCNDGRVRFVAGVTVKSVVHLIALIAVSAGAIVLLSVAAHFLFLASGKGGRPETYLVIIFGCLIGFFGACFIACAVILLLKCRRKYDVVIDDESVFLRYGSGYIRFNRYELGEIKTASGISHGRGDKDFEISRGGIRFTFGTKKRFIRIAEWEKLGYVMSNMAKFPDRGVDWGVAYDSK